MRHAKVTCISDAVVIMFRAEVHMKANLEETANAATTIESIGLELWIQRCEVFYLQTAH